MRWEGRRKESKNGVDKRKWSRSEFKPEAGSKGSFPTFVFRFPLFPWFSSVGNAYEWSTLKLIPHIVCLVGEHKTNVLNHDTTSDGKHNHHLK